MVKPIRKESQKTQARGSDLNDYIEHLLNVRTTVVASCSRIKTMLVLVIWFKCRSQVPGPRSQVWIPDPKSQVLNLRVLGLYLLFILFLLLKDLFVARACFLLFFFANPFFVDFSSASTASCTTQESSQTIRAQNNQGAARPGNQAHVSRHVLVESSRKT